MLNKTCICLGFIAFMFMPVTTYGHDYHIQCSDVELVDVHKMVPESSISDVKGTCVTGKDCFYLNYRLGEEAAMRLYSEHMQRLMEPITLFIGNTEIFSVGGLDSESAKLIAKHYSPKMASAVGDIWVFSKCTDALARVESVCPGKSVRYRGKGMESCPRQSYHAD